ncbi:CBS domain-containing protein CBSX5-like [Phalaenopsis equestris]|uniref:CBS domain-containing protein CBSX5-like n=1 Tax=Phalaenopsis equestris TaxID=78828 RepID=UPI0009E4853E|nr:CBS domain-containing protein CBSX5-like [Phalaenopsis equestris]
MAVNLLSHEVSDLCIGKPALRVLPISATIHEAILVLKQCGDTYISVWTSEAFAGKFCMVDILCYLCAEENISSPEAALKNSVSVLLSNETAALMGHVESHSRVIDALNLLLEGPRILWAPIQSTASHPKNPGSITGHSTMFCWLTQEDFARFFFNSIATFSPVADLSVSHLGLVRSTDVFTVHRHDPDLSFLPLISRALHEQTSVAVITHDRKLIGEISPSPLASCDESAAAALAALSAGDLMTYIDWRGSPPEAISEEDC